MLESVWTVISPVKFYLTSNFNIITLIIIINSINFKEKYIIKFTDITKLSIFKYHHTITENKIQLMIYNSSFSLLSKQTLSYP